MEKILHTMNNIKLTFTENQLLLEVDNVKYNFKLEDISQNFYMPHNPKNENLKYLLQNMELIGL